MGDSGSSLTPEQQLLKLIEAQSGKAAAAPAPAKPAAGATPPPAEHAPSHAQSTATSAPPPSVTGVSKPPTPRPSAPRSTKSADFQKYLSLSSLKGRISYAQEQWITFVNNKRESIQIKQIISLTRFGVIGLGVFLALGLGFDVMRVKKNYVTYYSITQQERADMPISQIRTFGSDFFQKVEEQNVFVPLEKRAETKSDTTSASGGTSARLTEMTQDFKLTGISMNPSDPSRTYCMIEDVKKNVTNFLRVGDNISGLTVSEITPESIELSLNEERIRLR